LVRQFSVPKLTRDSETMLNNPLDRGAEYKKLTNKKVITWSDVKNVEKLATGGHSCICTGTLDGEPVVVKFLRPEWEKNMAAIDEMDTEYGKSLLSFLRYISYIMHSNISSSFFLTMYRYPLKTTTSKHSATLWKRAYITWSTLSCDGATGRGNTFSCLRFQIKLSKEKDKI